MLALFVVIFFTTTIVLINLPSTSDRRTFENAGHELSQSLHELVRLYAALGRPSGGDQQNLRLRADTLWSRLENLNQGEMRGRVVRLDLDVTVVADLQAAVDEFVAALPEAARPARRTAWAERFSAFNGPLRSLFWDAVLKDRAVIEAEQRTTQLLYYLIYASLICAGVGGLMLVRLQARTARREAEAEARLATESGVSQAKSDFIAFISHEVRTPMNGVLGMTRLLRDADLNAEQRDYADTILRSGEALVTILNDVLDLSKLDAGKLDLETIAYRPRVILADCAAMVRRDADAKGLALTTACADDIPETLTGDPTRVRQILLNLASNAVKFTARGSVDLRMEADVDNGRRVLRVTVADTGPGIGEDAQAELFSPYAQGAADVARKFGGTGLGLVICRQLADLMDGHIALDSAVGRGSVFSLTLPLVPAADAPAADREGDGAAVTPVDRPLRILLAEDNAVNQRVAVALLAR
ncbi:MAG: ATP-binding protein, partial [Pseudomonadota bacterium]